MKSARIITKVNKSTGVAASRSDVTVPVMLTKVLTKKISSGSSTEISPETQFQRIKEALDEVELIEAGKIKSLSLKEALDEL